MSGTLTYPKTIRLTRSGEFMKVRREGRTYPGRFMIFGVLKGAAPEVEPKGLGHSRIGVVTSRRVGNAVTRNRVRRRLKELARLSQPLWKETFWLVVVARYTAATASWADLEKEWRRLARKADLLHAERPNDPQPEPSGDAPCSSGS